MSAVMATCLNLSGVTSPKKDMLVVGVYSEPYKSVMNGCLGANNFSQSEPYYAWDQWINRVQKYHPEVTLQRGKVTYDIILDPNILSSVTFEDYKMIYVPGQKTVAQCSNDFDFLLCPFIDVLTNRSAEIANYVNQNRGSIMALEESVQP